MRMPALRDSPFDHSRRASFDHGAPHLTSHGLLPVLSFEGATKRSRPRRVPGPPGPPDPPAHAARAAAGRAGALLHSGTNGTVNGPECTGPGRAGPCGAGGRSQPHTPLVPDAPRGGRTGKVRGGGGGGPPGPRRRGPRTPPPPLPLPRPRSLTDTLGVTEPLRSV